MKKKIFVSIIAVLLVACVTGTFAIWLGNVNQSKDFTINPTTDFLFVSSEGLAVEGNPTLLPGNSVTNKFNLKVKGKKSSLKLTCDKIEYSKDGGKTYKVENKKQLEVVFARTSIDVPVSLLEYQLVPCTAELKFVGNPEDIDPIYSDALFRFIVKVAVMPAV